MIFWNVVAKYAIQDKNKAFVVVQSRLILHSSKILFVYILNGLQNITEVSLSTGELTDLNTLSHFNIYSLSTLVVNNCDCRSYC